MSETQIPMWVRRRSGTMVGFLAGGDRDLDRAARLVRGGAEGRGDVGESEAMRDERGADVRALAPQEIEDDVVVGPRTRATVDEGADDAELLRQDVERREGRRLGEGAEDADRTAGARRHGGGL